MSVCNGEGEEKRMRKRAGSLMRKRKGEERSRSGERRKEGTVVKGKGYGREGPQKGD